MTKAKDTDASTGADPGVRLQKVLADAGYGSRRACEDLIRERRVSVDGKVADVLGTRVDPGLQKVAVDGERVRLEKRVYYLVNKPRGVLCTNVDPDGRRRVIDLVPKITQRVYTVGRLDQSSEGLILLTNDGQLANRLTHPRYGVEKTYVATVQGLPTAAVLKQVTDGVWSSEGKLRAERIRFRRRHKTTADLEVVLREGRNRHVRRMLAKVGHKVLRLRRVAIDTLKLGQMRPGGFRPLKAGEVKHLKQKFLPKS